MPDKTRTVLAQTGNSFRRNGLNVVLAVGAMAVATTLVEAILVPGLVIGAAAVVTPRLMSRRSGRRRQQPKTVRQPPVQRLPILNLPAATRMPNISLVRSLRLKEASLKTISFRVIVTVLDFGFNYLVLGELATAAGLSTITIVAGPFFYFLHETGWTYIRPLLPAISPERAGRREKSDYQLFGRRVSHAMAKTVTYRIFATASEFSTNYIVVRDLATAAWLSSFFFFIGPFIYFAHERLWEKLEAEKENGSPSTPQLLAPPTLDLRPI